MVIGPDRPPVPYSTALVPDYSATALVPIPTPSVRYYPLCVPPTPPHPGFDEAPVDVSYVRVETLADGTSREEIVHALDLRQAAGGGIRNADFVDEDLVAGCLADLHEGRLGYCRELGAWFVWDGTIWRRDADDGIIRLIRLLVRDLAEGNARALARVGTARFLSATERVARSEAGLAMPAERFDADPWLLGTPAGTVDLTTGALRPADPGDRISRATAVAPAETAECPLWQKFLAETFGQIGRQDVGRQDVGRQDAAIEVFLQRYLGYALTGDTSEHALLYGYGDGGNGKSVFVNTVRGIFGDYAAVAAPDLLTQGAARRAPTAEIAMLAGARLVTASETEEGRLWAEARLKLLTGGDPVTARYLGRDFFTFTPRFKLIVIGNHMPVLRSVDAALRRRLCVVPFAARPVAPDRGLAAKLWAEAPGILRWMIEGALAWRAEGLARPARVVEATEDYFAGQDLLGQFLGEACVTGPGASETAAALYAAWCHFAKAAGEPAGTQRLFAAALEGRGFLRERTRQARCYRGLRLVPAEAKL